MPYWRLFYHVVWATRDRAPLIRDAVTEVIEASIRASCEEPGLGLHAIGIMPDHVHLVVSIPPRLAVADFVGRLKGAASYAVNSADHRPQSVRFAWQSEYGILSFGERSRPRNVAYVRNQQVHHASGDLWDNLERTTDPN